MYKLQLLTIALVLLQNLQAQQLVGKWISTNLIDSENQQEEYTLQPPSKGFQFGHGLTLNPDGTFYSYRIPGCGLDRNPPRTQGKYSIIDENYIHFFQEKKYEGAETLINKELGNFYYYQKETNFILVKSTGNLEQDKKNVLYRNLLTEKENELRNYENLLNWMPITIQLQDETQLISNCLAENQINHYAILHYKPAAYQNQRIYLVQVGNDFKYVIYDIQHKRIALFDDHLITKTNTLVTAIDKDTNLKTTILKETYIPNRTSSENNTITVYRKKKKIEKIIYNQYFTNGGGWFTTFYFENDQPVYLEFEEKAVFNNREMASKIACYISDSKNAKIITKTIQSEVGKLYFPSEHYNRAINDVNQQLNYNFKPL
ncbi:hypothetical protein [Flavobacterium sp. GCM10023249]|uniref:hypothetical protein n=1 Tax=unclassified Flavobacterium TaxID=196869 RepID=UPI00361A6832